MSEFKLDPGMIIAHESLLQCVAQLASEFFCSQACARHAYTLCLEALAPIKHHIMNDSKGEIIPSLLLNMQTLLPVLKKISGGPRPASRLARDVVK